MDESHSSLGIDMLARSIETGQSMKKNTNQFEAACQIIETLQSAGHVAMLAGGCVRDRLIGKTPKDFDVATSATPQQVCRLFRRTKKVGAKFGVVLVNFNREDIEVATFRTDGVYVDGRHPESVVFSDAEHDAQRRDFTINGLFFDPVADKLVDHVGGQADLKARLIRCVGDANERFEEDHLRLLRAVRFASTLDFAIEPLTFDAMQRHARQIALISPERVRSELALMLTSPRRNKAWDLLCESSLAHHLVQKVTWDANSQAYVRRLLSELPTQTCFELALAAIFSTIGPEDAAKACRDLRCSNEEVAAVGRLLEFSNQLAGDSDLELADLKVMLASNQFEEICALATAKSRAKNLETTAIEKMQRRAKCIPTEAISPPPLLDGEFLLAQKIPQGPIYRKVLEAVYRAQLNEQIDTIEKAQAMGLELIQHSKG